MKQVKEKEWWIILFVVGIIILNYPLISIFNRISYLFGYPIFFLYLNIGWLISILILYLYVRAGTKE